MTTCATLVYMTRTQKNLIKYKKAVLEFINTYGYEPTAHDFDRNEQLPSARTIQRRYGGLQQFRKDMGLNTVNFTQGKTRTAKTLQINKNSHKLENTLFKKLVQTYGEAHVSTPARVFTTNKICVDFRLDISDQIYLIDVFHPKDIRTCQGCINIKNKKYDQQEPSLYHHPVSVLLVCTNNDIDLTRCNSPFQLLTLEQFTKEFNIV